MKDSEGGESRERSTSCGGSRGSRGSVVVSGKYRSLESSWIPESHDSVQAARKTRPHTQRVPPAATSAVASTRTDDFNVHHRSHHLRPPWGLTSWHFPLHQHCGYEFVQTESSACSGRHTTAEWRRQESTSKVQNEALARAPTS